MDGNDVDEDIVIMDVDNDGQVTTRLMKKRTQQSTKLTTTSTSSEMASMKAQTHFW